MENFFVKNELELRNIPTLFKFENGTPVTNHNADLRRKELLNIMMREVYGYMPLPPKSLSFEVVSEDSTKACAGKAIHKSVRLSFDVGFGKFSFVTTIMLPKSEYSVPFVVVPCFKEQIPHEYLPAEELIDRGIGFGTFCYKTDATSDDNDFKNGISAQIFPMGERNSDDAPGKIAMWAYCASRVLDYALVNENINHEKTAVAGHSRLGKTAILAAACDVRFKYAYSNNSGCSGAAITRGKNGERIEFITNTFPYWFCPNYKKYVNKEDMMPFDQHYLLASIAPRRIYVASAIEDTWADPYSEYLGIFAASKFWELYGVSALPELVSRPTPGDVITTSHLGYHIRSGSHYFSRYDWNKFIDFLLK